METSNKWRSIVGPVLFNVFINDLDDGTASLLMTQNREEWLICQSHVINQRDLDRLEKCVYRNLMDFRKGKSCTWR